MVVHKVEEITIINEVYMTISMAEITIISKADERYQDLTCFTQAITTFKDPIFSRFRKYFPGLGNPACSHSLV
jgi:hypothetical protein